MKKLYMLAYMLFAITLVFALSTCTDSAGTVLTVSRYGYSDIQTTGYSLFACSKQHITSTEFTALTPEGNRVNGVVCGDIFGRYSIRLF